MKYRGRHDFVRDKAKYLAPQRVQIAIAFKLFFYTE